MTRHAELWSEFVEIISIKPNDSPTQMGEFVVNFVMYKAGYWDVGRKLSVTCHSLWTKKKTVLVSPLPNRFTLLTKQTHNKRLSPILSLLPLPTQQWQQRLSISAGCQDEFAEMNWPYCCTFHIIKTITVVEIQCARRDSTEDIIRDETSRP